MRLHRLRNLQWLRPPRRLNPLVSCGDCDDCIAGRTNLCSERQLIGMARPGAFAGLVRIPERNLIADVAEVENGKYA